MGELSKVMKLLNDCHVDNNEKSLLSNYYEELFDSNYKCLIRKDANTIIPKYLVLHLNNDGTLFLVNELKEKIMFACLTCSIDDTIIYNISLKLLLDLSLSRIINNKLYILLPPYLFSKSLFDVMNNNYLILKIMTRGELVNIISRCSIILYKENISIDKSINKCENDLYSNYNIIEHDYQKRHIIQQLRSLLIYPNSKRTFFTNKLEIKGIMKGIFINADIYQLIEIKIFIDYQVYLNYDYNCINGYCKRIHSNLIYLPIANGCDYTISENESFFNAINLNNISSFIISLRFHAPQEKILLHVLLKNQIIELENKSRLEYYFDLNPLNITNSL
jgi:hypothetical protein